MPTDPESVNSPGTANLECEEETPQSDPVLLSSRQSLTRVAFVNLIPSCQKLLMFLHRPVSSSVLPVVTLPSWRWLLTSSWIIRKSSPPNFFISRCPRYSGPLQFLQFLFAVAVNPSRPLRCSFPRAACLKLESRQTCALRRTTSSAGWSTSSRSRKCVSGAVAEGTCSKALTGIFWRNRTLTQTQGIGVCTAGLVLLKSSRSVTAPLHRLAFL